MAKLLDFGLALSTARVGAPQLSGEDQVLGTPLFMSPEQVTGGEELDGRSDISSLGEDGIGLLIAHARDPVAQPSLVRDDIPEDLERVVLRCLAKDAADRFPDVESLELALSECACTGEWDQERAAHWWRTADRAPAARALAT